MTLLVYNDQLTSFGKNGTGSEIQALQINWPMNTDIRIIFCCFVYLVLVLGCVLCEVTWPSDDIDDGDGGDSSMVCLP